MFRLTECRYINRFRVIYWASILLSIGL